MPDHRSVSRRFRLAACASPLVALLVACGNAHDAGQAVAPVASTPRVEAAAAAASPGPASADGPVGIVRLEGCVADGYYIPRTGTPVRVLSTDGRLLGHATSGRLGEFSLRLVAQAVYVVAVDREGGESLSVRAGRGDVWMTSCLLDPER